MSDMIILKGLVEFPNTHSFHFIAKFARFQVKKLSLSLQDKPSVATLHSL